MTGPTTSTERPALSVVVAAQEDASALAALLADLRPLSREWGTTYEVIVAGAGELDGTRRAAEAAGARVVRAPRNEGARHAAGARDARGRWMAFLQADARLDDRALACLASAATEADEHCAWYFRLHIDSEGFSYRMIELGARLRARFGRLPHAAQGLLVSRALYDQVGGHPAAPGREDAALYAALAEIGALRSMEEVLTLPPKRFEGQGAISGAARGLRGIFTRRSAAERAAAGITTGEYGAVRTART